MSVQTTEHGKSWSEHAAANEEDTHILSRQLGVLFDVCKLATFQLPLFLLLSFLIEFMPEAHKKKKNQTKTAQKIRAGSSTVNSELYSYMKALDLRPDTCVSQAIQM